jgi:hypothetical protein
MRCPNCGENQLHFVALTDAHFEPVADDRGGFQIGQVIIDNDGIDCINESVREDDSSNVELHCPYCHSSFGVEMDYNGNYYIGEEL